MLVTTAALPSEKVSESMKFTKFSIRYSTLRPWLFAGAALLVLGLMGFVNYRQAHQVCRNIVVNLHNPASEGEVNFVVPAEIAELVNRSATSIRSTKGLPWTAINMRLLERKVRESSFVDSVRLWHNHAGELMVDIWQAEPILRFIMPDGEDHYMDVHGKMYKTTHGKARRVLVIDGPGANVFLRLGVNTKEQNAAKRVFQLVHAIQADPFCNALIGQIYLDDNQEATLYPLLGNQEILFGPAVNIEAKLNKLKAFYQEIIPARGWDKYQLVNLKFDNQIVCE